MNGENAGANGKTGCVCPVCNQPSIKIRDSRPTASTSRFPHSVRRRHVCPNEHRFTTYELEAKQLRSFLNNNKEAMCLKQTLRSLLSADSSSLSNLVSEPSNQST